MMVRVDLGVNVFRSSLVMFLRSELTQEEYSQLKSQLRQAGVSCLIRDGFVRRSPLASLKRRRSLIPEGTYFLAVDISSANVTKSHFQRMARLLPAIVDVCNESGLLSEQSRMLAILDMTVSIGSEDYFVRSLMLPAEVVEVCYRHQIQIRIDTVPCSTD